MVGYCLLSIARIGGGGLHRLPSMTCGRLVDYYLPLTHTKHLNDLMRFCIKSFETSGVDIFECQVLNQAEADICRLMTMREVGGNKVFFKPESSQKKGMQDPWFLTYGTSDVVL